MRGFYCEQTRYVMVPPRIQVFEAEGDVHICMSGGFTRDSDAPAEMRREPHSRMILDENEAMALVAWLNNAVEKAQKRRRAAEARRQRRAEQRRARRGAK